MEKLIEFWNENGVAITNIGIVLMGTVLTFLFNKFLRAGLNNLLNYTTQVVSKLFGGGSSLGDVNEHIKELPFIKDLQKQATDLKITAELKLIDLKRKMNLPNLSEIEKLVFENEYKVLYKTLENRISVETLEILDKIDELSNI